MRLLLSNFRPRGPLSIRQMDQDGFLLPDPFENVGFTPITSPQPSQIQPNAPLPPPPSPTTAANEVSGGATALQIDQMAKRFDTQEGVPLAIAYGENLVAGTLISHKYYTSVPKQNFFTVALGEGWGGLGKHGEWDSVVEVWYGGQSVPARYTFFVWMEDAAPVGASLVPDTDGWNFISSTPLPYSGYLAHQSPNRTGTHQHFFTGATATMVVPANTQLYCFVYLDPTNPPTEIMLQWGIGAGPDFEHRAYWGANSILFGTDGTNSRRNIGALPVTGQWVRLDIPASLVGLENTTVNSMAFTAFGGLVTWDQTGWWRETGQPGYFFRPGNLVTDLGDIPHANVGNFPVGLASSGTANITLQLTEAQSQEDRPDKFRGRFRCRRIYDFDTTGAIIGYGYSTNNARVAADRILNFFQRVYRDNLTIANQRFRARVDWPSWVAWRDYCDGLIPWNREGLGNVLIKRFEFHGAFLSDLQLADALDLICGAAATWWQDDGEKLIFVLPNNQTPRFDFNPSNITGPPRITPQDLRQRPNRFINNYREISDRYLTKASAEPPDNTPENALRQESQNRVGEIRSEREMPNMSQSQAQRLAERWARLEHDNPIYFTITGDGRSLKLLPGDYATITHPIMNWQYQLALILSVSVRSAEDSPDEVEFSMQKIGGPIYSDAAHTPIQTALTLTVNTSVPTTASIT